MRGKISRLGLRGLGVTVLAMFLTVSLAVPPATADAWDDYSKLNKIPAAEKHLYSYDYVKRSWVPNELRYGSPTPVSPSVQPSKGLAVNPSNTPISGKIIEPGKTVIKAPPSVYLPTAVKFGLGRILGTAGLGIGGTSLAPENRAQVAGNQGVTQGCIAGTQQCTADEIKKQFLIDNCGNLAGSQSCSSIGAVGAQGETDLQKWFRNDVMGVVDDLWGMLTGQRSGGPNPDGHIELKPKGCYTEVAFEYVPGVPGNAAGIMKFHTKTTNVIPRPSDGTTAQQYFDGACSTNNAALLRETGGPQVVTTCIGTDPNASNSSFGKTTVFGSLDLGSKRPLSVGPQSDFKMGPDGLITNASGLCGTAGSVPVRVQVIQEMPQAQYDGSPSVYGAMKYAEWLNPDPQMNTIEDTKITTAWDCQLADGTNYSFTKTLTKTAAMIAPDCGPGGMLSKHTITEQTGVKPPVTLDAGAAQPGAAAAYPDCAYGNCSMQLSIDNLPCTAGRPECATWPQVNAVQPSRVQCKWGNYTMPTSDCNVLSNAYKTESGVVFDPNSGTWVAIDAYGNPVASNPEPWNPVNPNPVPGSTPGTTPGTGSSGGTAPTEGTNPSSVPGTAGENCLSSGWSWNPVSWVMVPVQCALQWAFVPPQARVDAAARALEPKLQARGLEPFIAPFVTGIGSISGSGCMGPGIDLSSVKISQTLYPFQACTEPMSNIAQGVYSFFALAIVLQGGMSCIRGVAAAFGFNWGLGGKEVAE